MSKRHRRKRKTPESGRNMATPPAARAGRHDSAAAALTVAANRARSRPGKPRESDPALRPRFWETVPLDEMTAPEWEALCDGCGKCCVLKLEDTDTGCVHYTNVTCRLFDSETRRCGQYALRRMLIPGCVALTPDNLAENAGWMPATCAYRRLHEGRGLADWHPLISGDPDSVMRAGQALTGPTVPEYEVHEDDLCDYVTDDDCKDDGEGA